MNKVHRLVKRDNSIMEMIENHYLKFMTGGIMATISVNRVFASNDGESRVFLLRSLLNIAAQNTLRVKRKTTFFSTASKHFSQTMILNEFRLVGDFLHAFAILLLLFNIIRTRSCYSVSGLTITLYSFTFSFRYLDLFSDYAFSYMYNSLFKIYYLFSNYLLLFLIYVVFRKTRDQLHNTFPIFGYFIIAHLLTWVTCSVEGRFQLDLDYFWRFSIYLEMLAILPQLSLIYKQGTIDKVMTYYIIMLGSYRAFYILNWLYRYHTENYWEPIAFCSGCVQTVIYLYFLVRIYPRLNQQIPSEPIGEKKEFVPEKLNYEMPLVHTIV